MSRGPPPFDEGLAELRADTMLRTLAERDSLEPPRALDRAVLARARSAVQPGGPTELGRRSRPASALRWAIPPALAAAAVFAVGVHRTDSHSGTPRGAGSRVFVLMQVAPISALEIVRVSVRYRGAGGSSASEHHGSKPAFIETALSTRSVPIASPRERGSDEWARRDAARSRARALPAEREWNASGPVLMDGIDALDPVRWRLEPSSLQVSATGSSGSRPRTSAASRPRVPAEPRVSPASR